MKCGFDYCVYNKEFLCILDEIKIDSLGMCESCEIMTVPKESIERYKKSRLKQIEKIWNRFDE